MPPAPFQNDIFKSATAIIQPILSISSELKPLNLSTNNCSKQTSVAEDDFRKNVIITQSNWDPYVDATLSGGLERIHCDSLLDQLMENLLPSQQVSADTGDNTGANDVQEFPRFSDQVFDNMDYRPMEQCITHINRLTNTELNMWLHYQCASDISGYNLRERAKPTQNLHLARKDKMDITYVPSSASSQYEEQDDPSVGPRKWNKKCMNNIHVPSSRPSLARQAA